MRQQALPLALPIPLLWAALLAMLLLPVGCGDPLPPVPHHGLAPGTLENTPSGEAIHIGNGGVPLGAWEARLEVIWTRQRDSGTPRPGRAVILLEVTNAAEENGDVSTHLALQIEDAEGVAKDLVGKLDGVRLTFTRDANGRARRETLRFETKAPQAATLFFEEFLFAGFGLGRAWWPAKPVAVGEHWPRKDLGESREALGSWARQGLDPHYRGGGRLVAVEDGVATIALDALSEVEGKAIGSSGARVLSLGVLRQGEARVNVETGLPLTWHYESRLHYVDHDGTVAQDLVITEAVDGEVRALPALPSPPPPDDG